MTKNRRFLSVVFAAIAAAALAAPVRAQTAAIAPSSDPAGAIVVQGNVFVPNPADSVVVTPPDSAAAAPADLATVSGTAADSAPSAGAAYHPGDWYKLGGAWGPSKAWQFGIDTSPTLGACAFLGLAKGQSPKYILGPCRDFVLLAKNGTPIYHAGAELLGYDVADVSHSHPYYLARFGVNVGPAASSALQFVADRIPYVEQLIDWKAPAPLQYLGKITTVDGGGGPGLHAKPVWGAAIKANVPLEDLAAAFKAIIPQP